MPRLSVNEMTTYRWSFDTDVAQLADLGFRAVGVWRQKLADFGEVAAVDLLKSSGLKVSNLCWAGGFTGSDGRPPAEAVNDARQAIHLTAALEADCLVVYSGSRHGHTHNHARRLFRDAIDKLLPVAEELDVALAIKPVHVELARDWGFLNSLADGLEFVRAYDHPQVRLAFDTYHLGWDADVPGRLAEAAPHIAIVHFGDGHPPANGEVRRSRLGEGVIPLAPIFAALEAGGYTGYYDLKLVGMADDPDDYRELLEHSRRAASQWIPAVAVER
jgi:sugar phosphate isomerase/epimerase